MPAAKPSLVMLSAAKHLSAHRNRPFAALRVTSWMAVLHNWSGFVIETDLSLRSG
jgi:hypothetical protein